MANPTVTIGVANAASTIAAAVLVSHDDARFEYGDAPSGHKPVFPDDTLYICPDNLTAVGTIYAAGAWFARFVHTGTKLEFQTVGKNAQFRIRVDGVIASPVTTGPPSNGNGYLVLIDWAGVSATRTITIEQSATGRFGGIYMEAAGVLGYAGTLVPPKVVVIGDSFSDGTGADSQISVWAQSAADTLGWPSISVAGAGGTGYLAPGGYVKFRDRVVKDVFYPAPDIVIVAGGINDTAYSQAQLATEANLLFAQIKAAMPRATMYVLSPFFPRSPVSQFITDLTATLRTAAASVGATFIDMITDPWITGTGHVGATTGVGNADIYIGADSTHPTQAGHDYIGTRFAAALSASIVPAAPIGSQLCTLAQVKARVNPAGVSDTVDDALITELIDEVSSWVEHFTGRKLAPDNNATYVFSTEGGYVLRVPFGIRSISSMSYNSLTHQPDSGGSYTAIAAASLLLRPSSGDRPIGWPPTEVRLSRATTLVYGTIENGATITGNFGFAATPPDIQAVTIDAVVAAYQNRKMGASGMTGADGDAIVPWVSFFSSGSPQRATLERYRYIGMG